MRKIILTFIILFSLSVYSQDYPGEKIELLEGKELKVKPLREDMQEFGYKNFFTDPQLKKVYKKKPVYTKYSALVGKVFKLISYQPHYGDYILKIENPETGVLYYEYNTRSDIYFPFEVIGGVDFPEGFFCDRIMIDKTFDYDLAKYTYKTRTPCTEDICLTEISGKVELKVLITDDSSSRESGLKGLKLYLENNKEIDFPEAKISIEPSVNKYNFETRVYPTAEQFELLKENKIISKKIGTHEKTVEEGGLIKEYIKCLLSQ